VRTGPVEAETITRANSASVSHQGGELLII
jgi:hypothetical protein